MTSDSSLLTFVRDKMTMSAPYQPVVIRSLVLAGGSLGKRQLAEALLLADETLIQKSERILMRWPLKTLRKHRIVSYDRSTSTFSLRGEMNGSQSAEVVAICDEQISRWNRPALRRTASRYYRAIELSGGRCEACGVLAADRPLDVDHVVPRSRANERGTVQMADNSWVDVDDQRNLQVLCERCNRGKRDLSDFDFRPSVQRLAETIALVERRSRGLGYSDEQLLGALEQAREEALRAS